MGKTGDFRESWKCHLDPECLNTGEFHRFPYNVAVHCMFWKICSFRAEVSPKIQLESSLPTRILY